MITYCSNENNRTNMFTTSDMDVMSPFATASPEM